MSDYLLKIKALKLPEGEYMICGSSILEVLGIRKANDIDILVSNNLFNRLKNDFGWKRHNKYPTTLEHPEGIVGAKERLDFMIENYSLEEALKLATYIENIPFMSLEMLVNAKTQLGRDKDLKDIKLIKEYLLK